MKSFKTLALSAIIAIVAVGCNKVEKILPKKDGTWRAVSITDAQYVNNTLDTTYVDNNPGETYTFVKDGTGSMTDTDTTIAFSWTVNDDNDQITLCVDFLGVQFCQPMDVLESSKDAQTWFYSDKAAGDTDWYESTMELERVK